MRLSLEAKPGHTHVRGGRVCRSLISKTASTKGLGVLNPYMRRFTKPEAQVSVGDLYVEVIEVGTNTVLAHAYLTGDALQLLDYEFGEGEPVMAQLMEIVAPRSQDEADKQFLRIKAFQFGTPDLRVVALEYKCALHEKPKLVGEFLKKLWMYEPTDGTQSRVHLLGLIRGFGDALIHLHFQPPAEESKWAASAFQTMLVLSGLRVPRG